MLFLFVGFKEALSAFAFVCFELWFAFDVGLVLWLFFWGYSLVLLLVVGDVGAVLCGLPWSLFVDCGDSGIVCCF